MSASERQQWLGQEKYFRYSWTHAFFNWKRHRIMAGEKVRKALLNMPVSRRRVLELGCGAGDGLFDVHDVCSDIEGIQWFGLDLNYHQLSAGRCRSQFRVAERKRLFWAGHAKISAPARDAETGLRNVSVYPFKT